MQTRLGASALRPVCRDVLLVSLSPGMLGVVHAGVVAGRGFYAGTEVEVSDLLVDTLQTKDGFYGQVGWGVPILCFMRYAAD